MLWYLENAKMKLKKMPYIVVNVKKINKLENLEKLWLFVYSWGEIFEKVIRFIKLKKDCKKMENKV